MVDIEAIASKLGTIDYRRVDPFAKCDDGHTQCNLELWRKALESIMQPYIGRSKTNWIVEFKGAKRYLKKFPAGQEYFSLIALQALYALLIAREQGDVEKVTRLGMAFGSAMVEVTNVLWRGLSSRDAFKSYRRLIINRPEAMREAKAKANKMQRRERYREAEAAIENARTKYPTAAADNKVSFLKKKAAETLGINVGTLNRRLRNGK